MRLAIALVATRMGLLAGSKCVVPLTMPVRVCLNSFLLFYIGGRLIGTCKDSCRFLIFWPVVDIRLGTYILFTIGAMMLVLR